MSYIEIKKEKCTKCNACIEVCPTGILEMGSESVEETAVERCISCGHCATICPADAIVSSETNNRTPFTIKEIPADLPPQQALFHLKRSTRRFKEEPLDKNTIENLIQYGEKAPSSHNMRHRHYYVVTDKKKIQEMEDIVVKVYR
ncbi:MAG: 4Fe-4S dicluster domain-containing protein [bacterium]|nr:4Fe-4S dicluster domain-containing protein [bacterium]